MSSSSSSGMDLRFQELEKRVIAERTKLPVLPSISDIIGCDITIEDIQLAKQELTNQRFDLKKDVDQNQTLPTGWNRTPLIHFCWTGNLLIVRLLFLIGADCTQLSNNGNWFPMYVAAQRGHFDICKWLLKYGGDAKDQINKETSGGITPLRVAYEEWCWGSDKEGKTCRWLLLNGGGQHLSSEAMHELRKTDEREEWNSNLLVLWMRENIQLYHTFLLFLCGATTMITSSSSLSKRKIYPERSLQILAGHPGIMESIGDYIGLIRGKEIRMLQEFNESVIKYNNSEDDE